MDQIIPKKVQVLTVPHLISGYQIYHNYVRPHMSLDRKTPAEVCGINTQGKNKWLTLIQNASKNDINV